MQAERDGRGRHVGRGVSVGERATDRALVAHGGVPDHRRGLGDDRRLALEDIRRLHLPVGRHRADHDGALLLLDPREAGDLAEVDEVLGLGQAQLHHRHQAVAAGQDLGVLELVEQLERVLHRRRRVVLEGGWVHAGVSL
jgi:hypothetical protein